MNQIAIPPRELLQRIAANIEQVMSGQAATVRKLLAAFISGETRTMISKLRVPPGCPPTY